MKTQTNITKSLSTTMTSLLFRDRPVPVTFAVPEDHAQAAIASSPFQTWLQRCQQQNLEIFAIEIQSVDFFGSRGVGFVKLKADVRLDGQRLPGICFLRGDAVCIFVALFCDDHQVYSLLVQQPRVPIGHASCLELPAGMLDDDGSSIAGTAVSEMKEECGIDVDPAELFDLTEVACREAWEAGHLPIPALSPSGGGCDEFVRYFYLEKKVTKVELDAMRDRLTGLREHGELITLRVVPMADVWRISGDAKAMM